MSRATAKKSASPARNSETLLELAYSDTLRVDREKGVIFGVKVLGSESKNGRSYTPQAIAEAAEHYKGIGVNLNHPDRNKPRADRSIADRFGELQNVTIKDGAVYADLHYIRSHPLAEAIAESAERFPRQLGLSHNADGVTTRKAGKTLVEHVERVRSVDIVSRPATNASLFESEQPPVRKTIKQIVESAPAASKRRKRLARLLEIDPAMGEMPVEMPIDADTEAPTEKPEDQIKAGILAAILSKLESASEDELAAVMAALGLGDSLSAAAAGKAGSADAGGDAAGEATTESLKEGAMKELAALRESVNELTRERDAARKENAARQLLESLDREATPLRVKALTLLESEQERKQLIESWPRRQAASGQPPRRIVPLTESEQGEYKPAASAKEWAAAVR